MQFAKSHQPSRPFDVYLEEPGGFDEIVNKAPSQQMDLQTINLFAGLFHFTGNVSKFVKAYDIGVSFSNIHKSFMSFLEISLLNIDKKTKR